MTWIQSIPVVNAYRQVIGYIQVFEYVGPFTGGAFTYEAESEVAPFRTLSTRISIL